MLFGIDCIKFLNCRPALARSGGSLRIRQYFAREAIYLSIYIYIDVRTLFQTNSQPIEPNFCMVVCSAARMQWFTRHEDLNNRT